MAKDLAFATGEYVVYPTHGVGRVIGVEKQEISGMSLEVIVISFDKEKMTLRVPVAKTEVAGMRRLSTRKTMETAMTTLRGRARVKRTMWSRRAQEYEAKINSGDPVSIAEVVRDLHRNVGQPDRSYSERQLYEAAFERLIREVAAVDQIRSTPTRRPCASRRFSPPPKSRRTRHPDGGRPELHLFRQARGIFRLSGVIIEPVPYNSKAG
jgi:CarD family transcriptional regulator